MARRIGFFPIMIASFATTLAFTLPRPVRAAEVAPAVQADAVAERVAGVLETRYVVPALGKRYAAMLRANVAAGRYRGITDPAALAERITADLQAVQRDGHLRVGLVRRQEPPAITASAAPAAASPQGLAPGIREARWLQPGVAYIAFDYFSDDPAALAALTAFLRDHSSARALVIDARDHHGGAFPMLGVLGDALFTQPKRLAIMDVAKTVVEEHGVPFPEGPELRRAPGPEGLIRFEHWSVPAAGNGALARMPVYYLTSKRTFSAAEHMAMVLKSQARATLIGEPTGGGNHFGGTEEVGGGLDMFVPIGRTSDPKTGEDWEGRGVTPDIVVPADTALEVALRSIGAPTR